MAAEGAVVREEEEQTQMRNRPDPFADVEERMDRIHGAKAYRVCHAATDATGNRCLPSRMSWFESGLPLQWECTLGVI